MNANIEINDNSDLTPYEHYQLEKYGNVIKESRGFEFENGLQEAESFRKWSDDNEKFSLTEQEF